MGIGRPSTYVSIMSALRDRGYVRSTRRSLIPEDKGRIVTAFLESSSSAMWNMISPPTSRKNSTACSAGDLKRLLGCAGGDFSRPPSPPPSAR
ncbi:MAG: DNA topoisomerase [Hyphomicrobiales bacterium]